jgi:hypothetical protein
MRRLIAFASIAVMFASSVGCHHWQKRRAVVYSDCFDPCAGAVSVARPINSVAAPPVVSKVLPSGMASPQLP